LYYEIITGAGKSRKPECSQENMVTGNQ
jgi:hypothetical protein